MTTKEKEKIKTQVKNTSTLNPTATRETTRNSLSKKAPQRVNWGFSTSVILPSGPDDSCWESGGILVQRGTINSAAGV